jgi:hypothetical protein
MNFLILLLADVNTDRPVTACNLSAHPVKQRACKVILTKLHISNIDTSEETFAVSRYCDVI